MQRRYLSALVIGVSALAIGAGIGPGGTAIREMAERSHGTQVGTVTVTQETVASSTDRNDDQNRAEHYSTSPAPEEQPENADQPVIPDLKVDSSQISETGPTEAAQSAKPTQATSASTSSDTSKGAKSNSKNGNSDTKDDAEASPYVTSSNVKPTASPSVQPDEDDSGQTKNLAIVSFDCMIMNGETIYAGADFLGEGTVKLYINDRLVNSKESSDGWGGSVSGRAVGTAGTCKLVTSTGIELIKDAW